MQGARINCVGRTYVLACASDAGKPRNAGKRKSKEERRSMVQVFVEKYKHSNGGNFPSISLTHKKVGGSYYIVRDILRELKEEHTSSKTSDTGLEKQRTTGNGDNPPLFSVAEEVPSQVIGSCIQSEGRVYNTENKKEEDFKVQSKFTPAEVVLSVSNSTSSISENQGTGSLKAITEDMLQNADNQEITWGVDINYSLSALSVNEPDETNQLIEKLEDDSEKLLHMKIFSFPDSPSSSKTVGGVDKKKHDKEIDQKLDFLPVSPPSSDHFPVSTSGADINDAKIKGILVNTVGQEPVLENDQHPSSRALAIELESLNLRTDEIEDEVHVAPLVKEVSSVDQNYEHRSLSPSPEVPFPSKPDINENQSDDINDTMCKNLKEEELAVNSAVVHANETKLSSHQHHQKEQPGEMEISTSMNEISRDRQIHNNYDSVTQTRNMKSNISSELNRHEVESRKTIFEYSHNFADSETGSGFSKKDAVDKIDNMPLSNIQNVEEFDKSDPQSHSDPNITFTESNFSLKPSQPSDSCHSYIRSAQISKEIEAFDSNANVLECNERGEDYFFAISKTEDSANAVQQKERNAILLESKSDTMSETTHLINKTIPSVPSTGTSSGDHIAPENYTSQKNDNNMVLDEEKMQKILQALYQVQLCRIALSALVIHSLVRRLLYNVLSTANDLFKECRQMLYMTRKPHSLRKHSRTLLGMIQLSFKVNSRPHFHLLRKMILLPWIGFRCALFLNKRKMKMFMPEKKEFIWTPTRRPRDMSMKL